MRKFCVWFTGLSGSGKTTTAEELANVLGARNKIVSMLDGDTLRKSILSNLGFNTADRNKNVKFVASMAREIIDTGFAVPICALISPYREARAEARRIVGEDKFIEVYVNAGLEVCEKRDPKGLYAKARKGLIKNFTGIDDPYEVPLNPDIEIDTVGMTVEQNVDIIIDYLLDKGMC